MVPETQTQSRRWLFGDVLAQQDQSPMALNAIPGSLGRPVRSVFRVKGIIVPRGSERLTFPLNGIRRPWGCCCCIDAPLQTFGRQFISDNDRPLPAKTSRSRISLAHGGPTRQSAG